MATGGRRSSDAVDGCMRAWIAIVAAVLGACTYGPPVEQRAIINVAVQPGTTTAAVMVRYQKLQPPTGLTAFPDGGVPRMLEQRAELYVIDLGTGRVLGHSSRPAPDDRRVSFEPWVLGWEDGHIDVQATGCPGRDGGECYGTLRQASYFQVDPRDGEWRPLPARPTVVRLDELRDRTPPVAVGHSLDEVRLTPREAGAQSVVVFRLPVADE